MNEHYFQLMSAMVQRMGDKDDKPLPQDEADGCLSDEWSDWLCSAEALVYTIRSLHRTVYVALL